MNDVSFVICELAIHYLNNKGLPHACRLKTISKPFYYWGSLAYWTGCLGGGMWGQQPPTDAPPVTVLHLTVANLAFMSACRHGRQYLDAARGADTDGHGCAKSRPDPATIARV